MSIRNLIINADDFGMSREVNEGIKKGIKANIVNSVSVMANMPYFNDAIDFLKKHPKVSAGLHFNLTEGSPILPPKDVSSLIREDNNFFYMTMFLLRVTINSAKTDEIEKELIAQYNKLKKTGIKITHIDSHHHVHLFPKLFKIMKKFTDEKHTNSLRFHEFNFWNLFVGINKKPSITQVLINFLLFLDNIFYKRGEKLQSIDRFYDISWDNKLDNNEFLKILDHIPEGKTEIICHLGLMSRLGNKKFLYPRVKQLKLLGNKDVRKRLIHNGIKLVKRESDI